MSTFTPNLNLEEVVRGGDVGTWDTPTNNNWTVSDLAVGGAVTISLNNSNVILNAAQFQCKTIIFNSTLTGSVSIQFPSTFSKSYEVYNLCTGSSAFTITLNASNPGVNGIGVMPGSACEFFYQAANQFIYKNLPPLGSYWDYAGSSVPNWVTACAVPPFLTCDGTTFSSASYPILTTILGGTTLPDSRGRSRFALDGGTGRISSAATGFSGSSIGASGGSQTTTLSSQNVPLVLITDPGHNHVITATNGNGNLVSGGSGGTEYGGGGFGHANNTIAANGAVTGITAGSSSPTAVSRLPPAYIGGITMIRAG